VSLAFSYQIWQPTSFSCTSPSVCTLQLLFIPSWTAWTGSSPANWWNVYEGTPPHGTPGTTGSASLHLTAPIAPGTYYLWFCVNWPGLVNWEKPTTPGHIKVIVPAQTVTVTSKIPSSAVSAPLSVPLVPVGVVGVMVAVVGSVLVGVKKGKLRVRR